MYLQELVDSGCARAEHFTVVAHGCRGTKSEVEAVDLLHELLRTRDMLDVDHVLRNALTRRR